MASTLHLAALSGKSIEKAITALVAATSIEIQVKEESDFSYITTTLTDGTSLVLTRTDDFDLIASWVEGAPAGVNWQLILQRVGGLDSICVDQVCRALDQALGTKLTVYHMS